MGADSCLRPWLNNRVSKPSRRSLDVSAFRLRSEPLWSALSSS